MLSYSLSTLVPDRIGINASEEDYRRGKDHRGTGIFGFLKTREASVMKELEKYGNIRTETLERLVKILDENNFNVRMLVAADSWYRGNEYPDIFTPEMFTNENIHFLGMSSISFGGKRNWDKNSFSTLLVYANYLKNNVYNASSVIELAQNSDSEDDYFDYGADEDED